MDKANGKRYPGRFFDELDVIPKKQLLKYWNDVIPKFDSKINFKNCMIMGTPDNKYYVPEISEFHVGFEYEYLNAKDDWKTTNDFSNEYMYEDSPLYGVIKDLQQNKIRVKYLDKEDIESLGFKMSEEFKSEFVSKNPIRRILFYEEGHEISILDNITTGRRCSNLYIKNKSELKVLLKQLNILT
jgi:hypothetical protein